MRTRHILLTMAVGIAAAASPEPRGTQGVSITESGPLGIVMAAAGPAVPPATHGSDRDLSVREQQVIRRTFDLASAAQREVEVDNVWGSIEVTGTDSNQVQLVVNKSIRAESQQKLELARKEVTLDVTEQPGVLRLYVNGPFRCDCNCNCGAGCGSGCSGFRWRRQEYVVQMDFELRVPRAADITLRTVNSGHIRVSDARGQFSLHNVNGGIDLVRAGGSGKAHTVNGGVNVSFTENPRENSSFETVNGDIELRFARGLSADFRFKTFNGGIYSDFHVVSLPGRSMQKVSEGGKTIFRADRFVSARVGSGGPEITIENLNGDIRILERQ
jgi:hypothetical protein